MDDGTYSYCTKPKDLVHIEIINKERLIPQERDHYYCMAESQSRLLRHQCDMCTKVSTVEINLGQSYSCTVGHREFYI